MKTSFQVCTRCVMDTTDPDITFDTLGQCNHCTNYIDNILPYTYHKSTSEKDWELILQSIKAKGKSKKYDCLVGVSGGIDSSYVAHLCKEYGVRPLLWHLDNGWNTEISNQNVRKLANKLEYDLETITLDWNEFKEIQLAFLRSSIVDFEMPTDIAILGASYQLAAKHDIPTILSGGNFSAEGILPLQWGYHVMNDMKIYRHIVKKYSKLPLKNTPTAGFFDNFYFKFIKKIKTYYPLNYIDFNKDEAKEFLLKDYEFGDYGGKHQESKITGFWQAYVMPMKYNMDYRKATLSSQICSNQLTREEALEELNKPTYSEEQAQKDISFIANKLNISEEEFKSFLQLPPKTYVDFPNSRKTIEKAYQLYQLLKK